MFFLFEMIEVKFPVQLFDWCCVTDWLILKLRQQPFYQTTFNSFTVIIMVIILIIHAVAVAFLSSLPAPSFSFCFFVFLCGCIFVVILIACSACSLFSCRYLSSSGSKSSAVSRAPWWLTASTWQCSTWPLWRCHLWSMVSLIKTYLLRCWWPTLYCTSPVSAAR